uniref:Uncharacterized protein n=1 Tax=Hyaloperonospora arabidopsidis (strain Emoy2) TaxID=559515 RepID=M4BSC9_HYAAE
MTQDDSWSHEAVRRLRRHFASDRSVAVYEALTAHVLDAATGGSLFFCGVSAAQVAQKLLRIGSASRFLLPQFVGAAAVASSSVLSMQFASIPRDIYQEVAAQSRQAKEQRGWSWLVLGAKNMQPPTAWRLARSKLKERWEDLDQAPYPVYMVMGLLCFKLLGGRTSALAPSPFADLGAFHLKKASLPATADYATNVERGIIQEFGRLYGCHTVAKQADATLVRRILGWKTTFRFYPQCEPCSNQQSSVVKQWKSTLKVHLRSFRAYHFTGLWLVLLCTGGLYVGGSNFHETSEVSASTNRVDENSGSLTSSEFNLLVSLRERERKLRRDRERQRDSKQIAATDNELEAVARCKKAVKADIRRHEVNQRAR